ncbi:hypothetical protein [Brevibacillus sp. NRS-1366]|uniref:hypothetical protein n=1 Tax=Brevibacillus sp. NRS-1366 TaxID=3233899 RepID=UPI003D1EDECF
MIHIHNELTQIYEQVNSKGFVIVENSFIANEAIQALKHCYSDIVVELEGEGNKNYQSIKT